ncbi:MAG: hypothetical protein SVM80_02910 [Halobacteriota archaeon]|nr:hypothetical protein [Halobacteriota archaeon]
MDLKLEVKKLERRETKDDPTNTWCMSMNPEILGDILDSACCNYSGGSIFGN